MDANGFFSVVFSKLRFFVVVFLTNYVFYDGVTPKLYMNLHL